MRSTQLLLVVGVAIASAVATSYLLRNEAPSEATELDELRATIDRLERRLDEMGARAHQEAPGLSTVAPKGLSEQQVRSIVREMTAGPDKELEPTVRPVQDVARVVATLVDPAVSDARKEQLWARVRASGRLADVVAAFERRVESEPLNSRVRTDLAFAYFRRMLAAPAGPERGRWGKRGADTLVEALKLDEMNWDARFALAKHYYWADMKADSIREFEILVKQQATRRPEPKHAQAYLWLGNLRLERGERAAARNAWSDGAALFPANKDLAARLQAHPRKPS